jgi:serine/threonine protein phosphatase PrpC
MADLRVSLVSFAGTDVGRRRKNNEDAFLVDDVLGLWVVADGMGGQAAGEVASQQAVETVHEMVISGLRRNAGKGAERVLESAIQAATYMVFGLAEMDRTKVGMGTTVSAALVQPEQLLLAQVGDSRIYRVRNGEAIQLTEDHTLINWQIQNGIITAEEAKTSKQKNVITRAVGNRDYVQVDILSCDVRPGDTFVLCSDGLYAYVLTEELPDLVAPGGHDAVSALIRLANDRGGKDNITAVVVHAFEDPDGPLWVRSFPEERVPETVR